MASLIDIVRKRFLEALRTTYPGQWKVLVVDEHSQRLLGANLKQNDVLAEKVTTIDLITNFRAPEPNMQAMYLLMPTTQNVDRIIKDFSGQRTYAGAHLYFTDHLSEKLLSKLVSSPAEPFLRGCNDMYINFWAIESQVFSLYAPSLFFSMYSPPRSASLQAAARDLLEEDLAFISRCIVNLCVQLNENPLIRYYLPSSHPALGPLHSPQRGAPPPQEGTGRWKEALGVGSRVDYSKEDHLPKLLALMVQEELDHYKKLNPDWPQPIGPARPQAVLFVTDRTMDIAAALIHEFTFQAMCNDLLDIINGVKFRYKFQSSSGVYEDKVATISDADSLWTQVRHIHMREAIDKLMGDFNKFLEQNAGFSGGGAATLNDMKDMLANLPQYQEQREQFSLHLNMAQQCMDMFEKKKLTLTASIEQNCATGVTPEGKAPKSLVEDMVPLLADSSLSNSEKVRIIALYIMYRDGVPDEDKRRLFQHAGLSKQEQAAVNNLAMLGVRVTRTPNDRDTRKKLKNRSSDDDYDLSRYKPILKTVIEDHFDGKLDVTVFPYVNEPVAPPPPTRPVLGLGGGSSTPTPQVSSLRSKPQWHKAASGRGGASAVPDNRQRVLVFVAGGMTYSEMRTAYQLSNSLNKDVYIGSTHSVTPQGLLDDLAVLELGGAGSQSIPNGLPASVGTTQRPFQVYYDKKYYTADAPPPRPSLPTNVSSSGASGRSGIPSRPGPNVLGNSPSPSPMPSQMSGMAGMSAKDKEKRKKFLGF